MVRSGAILPTLLLAVLLVPAHASSERRIGIARADSRLAGALIGYDAAAGAVLVRVDGHTTAVRLAPGAVIREGGHTITAPDLNRLRGNHVKVGVSGTLGAASVMVSPEHVVPGTLDHYDATSGRLTILGNDGTATFVLTPATWCHNGEIDVPCVALDRYRSHRVKVTTSLTNGEVLAVRLFKSAD